MKLRRCVLFFHVFGVSKGIFFDFMATSVKCQVVAVKCLLGLLHSAVLISVFFGIIESILIC